MHFVISAFSSSSNRYIILSLKSLTSFSLAKARVAAHAAGSRRMVEKRVREWMRRQDRGIEGKGERGGQKLAMKGRGVIRVSDKK